MYDIITIGSAVRDIFARSSAFDIHKSKHSISGFESCLPLGAKIDINELSFETGGGATNTAAAFANFGMKTAAVCHIGKDFAGTEIIRVLKSFHVDTRFINFDPKARTSYSIILLTEMGERTILNFRGASKNFNDRVIPWKNLKSKWLYISSLGGNLKLLKKILNVAEERKIKVGWNPGGIESKMGFGKLAPLMNKMDAIIMNDEEAKIITDQLGDLNQAIKILSPLPRRALVITQGGKGALAVDQNETLSAPSSGNKAVNTTGAGDAFSSGFIAGLYHWGDVSLALRLGILNSGMVVTKTGAKNGLLPRMPTINTLKKLPIKYLKSL